MTFLFFVIFSWFVVKAKTQRPGNTWVQTIEVLRIPPSRGDCQAKADMTQHLLLG